MDLKGKALSASMINTFLECPRKFQKRYVERIRIEKATDHLPLGTAFHAAMEEANTFLMENGAVEDFTPEQKESFLTQYRDTAVDLGLANMEVFEEGVDLVEKALDRMNKHNPILGVELEFNIETPDGVPIMGYIDLVSQISDHEVLIKDYKTSRIAKSSSEVENDVQVAMYDYAASVMFPTASKIWVELDYARFDKPPVRVSRDPAKRESFLKFLKSVHDRMLAFEPNEDIAGRFNTNCSFCDYNQSCNEYVTTLNSHATDLTAAELLENADLVTEIDLRKAQKKAIDARIGHLTEETYRRMETSNEVIHNGEKQLYTLQGTTRVQDVDAVVSSLPQKVLLEHRIISKINNKELDAFFRKNPNKELQMYLDSKAQVKFNNPSIRMKKVK